MTNIIVRPAEPGDLAAIQRMAESELDLEPDAGELPGILMRGSGHLGLVAEDSGEVVGVCFGGLGRVATDGPRPGHVELLAVRRDAQGRGTGRRLLSGMESLLREQGARIVLLRGNPPVYVWPGVDARYTVMTCLAERAGYEKYRDAVDMAVSLGGADLATAPAEEELAAAGIEVRRAAAAEAGRLVDWLRQGPWGASGWPDEVSSALAREPAGCHVACRGSEYVGFACHGSGRRGWFGPMGTDQGERQHGIGTILLKRCLADMAAAGLDTARLDTARLDTARLDTARIGWVGPVRFYARVLGARVERVYWLYRKALLAMASVSMASAPREIYGCLLARFDGTGLPDWLRRWLDRGLAGVLLFAGNISGPDQLRSLTAQLREHNPDVLIAVDEEGGIVTRVEAAAGSSYPGNAALGAIDDPGLTRQVALSIGAMLADAGVSLNLAPVADLDANAANPVIGVRSFGAEPVRVAAHTAAFVTGLQDSGVAACAKHFPGHGRAGADSHLQLPTVDATLAELRDTDLLPFRAAVDAGVKSVLTAHVLFPAIDDVPATLSSRLLRGVLRDELGFGGVVVTDALGMAAIGDGAASAAGAVAALGAGADLLCMAPEEAAQRRARDALTAALAAGELSKERVAEANTRIGALASWAASASRTLDGVRNRQPEWAPSPDLGLEAAARALLIDGAETPLERPPFVLDAGGRMSVQLEDRAASLLGVLRGMLPETAGVRIMGPEDLIRLEQQISAAAGRPLVVVVRDAHRQPWQRGLLRTALRLRPDALVVGTGTVHDRDLAGRAYIGTRGASRASLLAAASLLTGRSVR
jgi:beta-N-acetylhexosaminidase